MSVKYGLLGVLAKQPRHGYELKAAFEEKAGGFWDLNYGQIYSTLDRLVRDGLVAVAETVGDGGRERKVYKLTNHGAVALRRWLRQPVTRQRPLRDELFIKLALMDPSDPEPMLQLIEQQRQHYLAQMARLTQQKLRLQSLPANDDRLMTDLLVDAGLFHAEADLRWLDHCESRIRAHSANHNHSANSKRDTTDNGNSERGASGAPTAESPQTGGTNE